MWAPESDGPAGPLQIEAFAGNWGDPFGARITAAEMAGYDWTDFGWTAEVTVATRSTPIAGAAAVTDDGTTSTALALLASIEDGTVLVPDQRHTLRIVSAAGSPIEGFTLKTYILTPRKAPL